MAAVLLFYAVRTYQDLAEMQEVYLRDRAATLAARLETFRPEDLAGDPLAMLRLEDSALVDLRVYDREHPRDHPAQIAPLWSGEELFRTEGVASPGQKLFRAYIPFHIQSQMHIARIDLAWTSTEFLLANARHNLLLASLSALSLLTLALWGAVSARRTAALRTRQLELEHLAHLGQLSAVLAHEIRNPLGTIKGFAQLACERTGAATTALLEPALNEIRRLEKLVEDLLLYSRPCQPRVETVEWGKMAGELDSFARDSIGDRPVHFTCEPRDLSFATDPDLLKQTLLNLIRNAIEAVAADGPGKVQIDAAGAPGRGVLIAVEDDGPGIAPAAEGRMFEPFFTTKASGTGLGLNVARKLARSLGGDLRLAPAHPHGTRAELILPGVKVEHGTNSRH